MYAFPTAGVEMGELNETYEACHQSIDMIFKCDMYKYVVNNLYISNIVFFNWEEILSKASSSVKFIMPPVNLFSHRTH